MGSLNRYASHIANVVGRPMDHALMERAKESIKAIFATRIRQSTFKYGVDYNFVLTCEVPVKPESNLVSGFKVFTSTKPVPKSIRFANDAPFVRVTATGLTEVPFSSRSMTEIMLSNKSDVKGFHRYYTYGEGVLKLYVRPSFDELAMNSDKLDKAFVTSIFENPEEVMALYSSEDMSDLDLPYPNEMFESIVAELLQTEFRIQPAPEVEVKV